MCHLTMTNLEDKKIQKSLQSNVFYSFGNLNELYALKLLALEYNFHLA